jgi:endonuclease YncB( thermonuclease family)
LPLAACDSSFASDQASADFTSDARPSPGKPATRLANAGDGFTCTVASITDGDTFRCRETEANGRQIRVRLSGVAARERDGSCTPGHPCPEASSEAATEALAGLALGRRFECREVGRTYDRRAAFCRRDDGVDLSCAMVESGTTLVWDRYWGNHSCERSADA